MAVTRSRCVEDEIVERLSRGETLSAICRDEHMPDRINVYRWADQDEEFASRIAHARDLGEVAILDDTLKIADDQLEDAQSRKVRIWARHEALKRWNPKKWGEKTDVNLSGNAGFVLAIHEHQQG